MSHKIGVLKNLAILYRRTSVFESFLNKVQDLQACNSIKKRLQQVFSCEYCKIFKNTSDGCFYRCSIKKAIPKNFASFTRTYRYPFLSSCRLTTCNFVKIVGLVGTSEVFCCEFWEVSQENFMQNNSERLFLEAKRCCGK